MSRLKKSLVTFFLVVLSLGLAGYIRRGYIPHVVAIGTFHQVAHKGEGTATILELGDARKTLRLKDFRTANLPGLSVLLISAEDAPENDTVLKSAVLSLGPLQKPEGEQEYAVPAETDLSRYHAVTIWNEKYKVNFTTAPLRRD